MASHSSNALDPGIPTILEMAGNGIILWTDFSRAVSRLMSGASLEAVLADGTIEISAHYVIEIDGEGLVEIQSDGVRANPDDSPNTVYFRTLIRFRTSAPCLARLNKVLAISNGRRDANQVLLDISEIL